MQKHTQTSTQKVNMKYNDNNGTKNIQNNWKYKKKELWIN